MKSPWNFLTRLTSRRKQDDASQNSVGHAGNQKAIESEAQKPALLLGSPEVATGVAGNVSAARDLETTTSSTESNEAQAASAVADLVETQPDLHAPVSEDLTTTASSKIVRTKRGKTDRSLPVETKAKALARNEDQVVQSVPSENPFLDEVSKLDEDIRILRSQLTQKLALQNDHLKKMLERFDRS